MASSAQEMNIGNVNTAELDKEDLGKGVGISIGVLAIVMGCFNLCFIIPDLIYAYEGSLCVISPVEGFSFQLRTWLEVDAYTRIALVVLLLIVAIVACVSLEKGMMLGGCVIVIIILYSIFTLAWTIVGSVMFWGKLLPQGKCYGGVKSYMYALLIISYIGICCNCLYSTKSRNTDTEATAV